MSTTRSPDVRFDAFYAYALDLSAFYGDAHEQALLLFADASEFRIDPALPYAHSVLAVSLAGVGRYADAHLALDDAARESGDATTSSDYRTYLRVA